MMVMSLLFLSVLLTVPLAAIDVAHADSPGTQIERADLLAAQGTAMAEAARQFRDRVNFADDSNDICYKIRAYIFERDDDHAAVLKGSTTCGPHQPRTKNVIWPGRDGLPNAEIER